MLSYMQSCCNAGRGPRQALIDHSLLFRRLLLSADLGVNPATPVVESQLSAVSLSSAGDWSTVAGLPQRTTHQLFCNHAQQGTALHKFAAVTYDQTDTLAGYGENTRSTQCKRADGRLDGGSSGCDV